MKQKHRIVNFTLIFFSCFFLFCLLSCGMRAEQKSLTSQFNVIDALISQNQYKDATKELKKLEKQAYDSWSYLGIYRRYKKLGEKDSAQKVLKNALKKNGENQELLAVYTKDLINEDRLDEAVNVAKKLKGGKFGSIYSEAILKQASSKSITENKFNYFNESQFYDIYYDAYQGSKNPVWLRNCAVHNLTQGQFGVASRLSPDFYSDADDSYFWALVNYDAGKYYEAIGAIEKSKQFLQDYENQSLFKTSFVKQIALESDAYMAVSQMENAEKVRQQLLVNMDLLKLRNEDKYLIPIIYTNSAVWAKNQGLSDSFADLLFYVVVNYPDYVPALIQYADFAYYSNLERQEDSEIKALRKAGISTIEMETYDSRRKIPLSDAMYRIENSLKRQKNAYLEIKKIDIAYKSQKNLTEKEKNRNLWYLLESNYDDSPEFRTLLVQYAINYLLSTKQYDDAWMIYEKYVKENLNFEDNKDFWDSYVEQMKNLDLQMVEIGGWFVAYNKLVDESLRIYEYCVYESNGILADNMISQYVSTAACMNLADIYYSLGKKEKAIELYGKAVGRESKNSLRSEIYYRIACIYYSMGDVKSALRSAEYAKDIYPENVKASLLKDKCGKL